MVDYCEYVKRQLEQISVSVDDEECRQLSAYLEELLRWNKKINLTSIVDIESCWEKHIVDSLLPLTMLNSDERLLDIGSGAGLPGIPLKIVRPGLRVVSVDSVTKKINFQRHVARMLGLQQFNATASRIEKLRQKYASSFDVVLSRAYASLELFIEQAIPFVGSGGRIIAMKGVAVDDEIEQASAVITENRLHIAQKKHFKLQPSGSQRIILELKFIEG